jgi:hypothetical protein
MIRRDISSAHRVNWASALNVLAGIWLIASAWVFRFAPHSRALWNTVIVGILIAMIAICRSALGPRWAGLSWFNAVLGGWMIASPWIHSYIDNTSAAWNSGIVGVLVVVLACFSETAPEANGTREALLPQDDPAHAARRG